MHQEMRRSAVIGMVACLILAGLAGGSPTAFVAAVIWGSSIGALIGLLLWSSSADAPETPVSPPSAEQARGRRGDKLPPPR